MDWLRENLFWIVIAVLFFWMHTKMHGGHGGHGHGGCGHGGHGTHERERDTHRSPDRPHGRHRTS